MTGRIRKFDQPDANRVKIVGANEIVDKEPQRLDYTTKQQAQPIEIHSHAETITEKDKLRGKKPEPGEPEVRVRAHSREWPKVKRDED